MDGTLIDSTPMWDDLPVQLLHSFGCEPSPTLVQELQPLGPEEIARVLYRDYRIQDSFEALKDRMDRILFHYYSQQATLKPGAADFLDALRAHGIPMAIATATGMKYTEAALRHVGIDGYFSCVLCCEELGHSKYEPFVFLEAAREMGALPEQTWVFEDSLHALRTAKQAGFPTCALEDSGSDAYRAQIRQTADVYLRSFRGWEALPFAQALK